MKKKIYNQPATELMNLRMENVMLTVSDGGTPPGGGGPAHAPGSKGDLIP